MSIARLNHEALTAIINDLTRQRIQEIGDLLAKHNNEYVNEINRVFDNYVKQQKRVQADFKNCLERIEQHAYDVERSKLQIEQAKQRGVERAQKEIGSYGATNKPKSLTENLSESLKEYLS